MNFNDVNCFTIDYHQRWDPDKNQARLDSSYLFNYELYLKNGAGLLGYEGRSILYRNGHSGYSLNRVTHNGKELGNNEIDYGSGLILPTKHFQSLEEKLRNYIPIYSNDSQKSDFEDDLIDLYPLNFTLSMPDYMITKHNVNPMPVILDHIVEMLGQVLPIIIVGRDNYQKYKHKLSEKYHMPFVPSGLADSFYKKRTIDIFKPSDITKLAQMSNSSSSLIHHYWMVSRSSIFYLATHKPDQSEEYAQRLLVDDIHGQRWLDNSEAYEKFMDIPIKYNDWMAGYDDDEFNPGDPILFLYNPREFINYIFPEISIRRVPVHDDLHKTTIIDYLVTVYIGTARKDNAAIYMLDTQIKPLDPNEELY